MAGFIAGVDRGQLSLLPGSLDDWVGENNPVRVIDAFVEALDLKDLGFEMTREMATLGKDVAAGLAERLGLEVVHHELVKQDITKLSGLPESEVHRFLEG